MTYLNPFALIIHLIFIMNFFETGQSLPGLHSQIFEDHVEGVRLGRGQSRSTHPEVERTPARSGIHRKRENRAAQIGAD
jgi:hypothetical protein